MPTSRRKFDLYSRTTQLIIDVCIFAASLATAYLIRFRGIPGWQDVKQLALWLPYVVAARLVVNWRMGIYRFVWRYISLPDSIAVGRSLSIVTLVLAGLRLFYPSSWVLANRLHVPLGVIVVEYVLCLTGTVCARALRRLQYERGMRKGRPRVEDPRRILLYGAGSAGILLVRDVKSRPEIEVVGFIDDDPKKIGSIIGETSVLGNGNALERIIPEYRVNEVIISITSPPPELLRTTLRKCRVIPVPLKIIPNLQEILLGVGISHTQDVRLEDLLGREGIDVSQHEEMIREMYSGKRILVTGAGGSIGSELVRQLARLRPQSIALLDKDENSVYELQQEMCFLEPQTSIVARIGDIRYSERLQAIFGEFNPEIVFHAAAHKHVPLMEQNPCEAILNNVAGTEVLLRVCREWGVEQFIYISSDKAVNPVNVMGATKRIGEVMVRTFAKQGGPPAACVRFGNVLGSRGSVIPLFEKQIARGGPITVTHPETARYFMTIPEAVRLVLCAGTLGRHGETFVFDMGSPRKILDIANELVVLAGLQPGEDIEVKITGLRPGEKLHEELVGSMESVHGTQVDKLLEVTPNGSDHDFSLENLNQLIHSARRNDVLRVLGQLRDLGIGFRTPQEAIPPQVDAVPQKTTVWAPTSTRPNAVLLASKAPS